MPIQYTIWPTSHILAGTGTNVTCTTGHVFPDLREYHEVKCSLDGVWSESSAQLSCQRKFNKP